MWGYSLMSVFQVPPIMNDQTSELVSLSVAELAQFGQLFDEHRTRLLAMLRRRVDPRLRARLDAEDILQDAYLLARQKWPAFRAQQSISPRGWLYQIARDCFIEHYRKATRKCRDPRREVPWPEQSQVALVMGLVDTATKPSAAAQRREFKQRIKHAMALLPAGDREILWMRHFDQLSNAEIAEFLAITTNNAAVRYVRAVERLKRLWHEAAFDTGQVHDQ
jgi:RNA polymerase sigma-70 factor, ECF subfamily